MEVTKKLLEFGRSKTLTKVKANSPVILTRIGCLGVIGTEYLAANKVTPKKRKFSKRDRK